MEKTILLHDALRALARGHLLRKVGSMSDGLYLEQVPEIALVFDHLKRHGCLREIEFQGRNADSLHFFTLSAAGRDYLGEVEDWYSRLPWYRKLLGRLGFPLPQ